MLGRARGFDPGIQGQQLQGAQFSEDVLHGFDDVVAGAGDVADQLLQLLLLLLLRRDVDADALQEQELVVVVEDAGTAFVDPQWVTVALDQAIVDLPLGALLDTGADRGVDRGAVLRIDDGGEGADAVVEEVVDRVAGQRFDALGQEQHRVAGVVLASVEEAVEAACDALDDIRLNGIVHTRHHSSQPPSGLGIIAARRLITGKQMTGTIGRIWRFDSDQACLILADRSVSVRIPKARSWLRAGIRALARATSAGSMSASTTPSSSPPSARTVPQGSTISEWP